MSKAILKSKVPEPEWQNWNLALDLLGVQGKVDKDRDGSEMGPSWVMGPMLSMNYFVEEQRSVSLVLISSAAVTHCACTNVKRVT